MRFKVGDKVRVISHRPSVEQPPGWSHKLDYFLNTVITIESIDSDGFVVSNGHLFNTDWLLLEYDVKIDKWRDDQIKQWNEVESNIRRRRDEIFKKLRD